MTLKKSTRAVNESTHDSIPISESILCTYIRVRGKRDASPLELEDKEYTGGISGNSRLESRNCRMLFRRTLAVGRCFEASDSPKLSDLIESLSVLDDNNAAVENPLEKRASGISLSFWQSCWGHIMLKEGEVGKVIGPLFRFPRSRTFLRPLVGWFGGTACQLRGIHVLSY
ncbi:uncharacterized protein FOMMEDRAFT_26193 [Fomitiporia mediterranea MF3/22]|uniref:uncharacterized protein n=1 Tax=Fomitiporia mediterranea (strain MF3/22) TaxID=694068 RepID=UPI000440962F|nr:uncharacterized protein FOMMEDRAFT_26193 [Fomitiporia mediterranea MF3/22]EJD07086.1 hypothetical protein FOMMEDRAFT_26193 [Fomitiporia mediterranea MF3/22]